MIMVEIVPGPWSHPHAARNSDHAVVRSFASRTSASAVVYRHANAKHIDTHTHIHARTQTSNLPESHLVHLAMVVLEYAPYWERTIQKVEICFRREKEDVPLLWSHCLLLAALF
jgi:hypothetical protein